MVADVVGVSISPILWVYAPEDDLLVEGGGGSVDVVVDAAIGWAEELDWLAGDGLNGVGGVAKIA